jgi:hypothetical protein
MILDFLHSVARSKVLAHHITAKWDPTKDADWRERLIFWASSKLAGTKQPPGVLTVSWGDESKINGEADKELASLSKTFGERVSRSPKAALDFMEEQERARQRNLGTIDAICRDVKAINVTFREEFALLFAHMILIKCEATIIMKTIGLVEEGIRGFFCQVGYDVAVTLATEWSEAEKAEVIASAGREAEVDAWQKIAENTAEHAAKDAEAKMAGRFERTGTKAVADLFNDVLKNTEDEAMKAFMKSAHVFKRAHMAKALAKGVGKGIVDGMKALWFAKDVYIAVREAHESFRELDYVDTVRRRLQ